MEYILLSGNLLDNNIAEPIEKLKPIGSIFNSKSIIKIISTVNHF